jgi:trehalose/maltose hydrolase-like predicted phosphorylase
LKKSSTIHSHVEASPPWTIAYERFDPAEEGLREALCTLGNGYFGTRGAACESGASKIHYPGTYVAGLYNRLITNISGKRVVNEDLVNCPNWLFITFKIGDGEWFYPSTSRILAFSQKLNMKSGILRRRIRFQNKKGQKTFVETSRIVSMDNPHYGAIEYIIIPENYSELITVRTMLDGTVLNTGVERYRQLNSKHWNPVSLGSFGNSGIYLSMKTSQSRVTLATAARIRLFSGNRRLSPSIKHLMKGQERIGQEFRFFVRERHSYAIEKIVSIYNSKDAGVKDPMKAAISSLKTAGRFKKLLSQHKQVWSELWEKFDIKIDGDAFTQRVIRFHTFHLLQTLSPHNIDIDVGMPARGLNGEAYRGHIFWDSIFVMPLFDKHLPEVSKSLLLYRYRRLPKAREYARSEGYQGAMFPWQSGSTGREETQELHLNPMSGKWGADLSRRQRHISFAIAYNVWGYWRNTNDLGFLIRYGAEMIIDIARFWASLVKYDPSDGKYHTKGIMGPDEFHEKVPGATKPGLKDNAYTNIMIVWTLLRAQEIMKILPPGHKSRLMKKIKLKESEFQLWDDIIHKMNIIFNNDGIISQFDGYFELKELDWEGYKREYVNIHRMDRILKAEGKSPNDYKVAKQADVLMVFHLLPLSEIEDIFRRLQHKFDKDLLRKNYEYYIKRTSHGSTMSKVVHCYIAQLLKKPKESWKLFVDVLQSDIYDVQGGTTPEGIHCGVMGGSIALVTKGYAGLRLREDRVIIDPHLPLKWRGLKFKFLYKGMWVSLAITRNQVLVLFEGQSTIPVEIKGKLYYPPLGKTLKVPLKKR